MDPATSNHPARRRPRWARALLLQTRRAALRLQRPLKRNQAWTVAAVTGTAGIGLLFLMYLAQRDAALAAADLPAPPETAAGENPSAETDGTVALVDSQARNEDPAAPFELEPDTEPPLAEPVQQISPPVEPIPLEVELVRLPGDSREQLLASGASIMERPAAEALPWDSADEWRLLTADRRQPGPPPVLYTDRLSPQTIQQLSASLAAPEEPPATEAAEGELEIAVERTAPASAAIGRLHEYQIVVRNDGAREVARALVEEELPEAYSLIDVSPPGLLEGTTLRWQIRGLEPGEEQRIAVQVIPREEGAAESAAAVRAYAAVGATTLVQSLQLQLESTLPERISVGQLATIRFEVTNTGTAAADGVLLRVDLPEVLAHRLGRRLDCPIGTLAPGEAREALLTVLAEAAGTADIRTETTADGDLRENAVHRIEVAAPSLQVRRWGVPRVSVGQTETFANRLINRSDQPVTDVELFETVPPGFDVISISDGGRFDPEERRVHWTIAQIEPGATIERTIALRATRAGEVRTVLEARTREETTGPVSARVEAVPARIGTGAVPAARLSVPCCR